MTPRLSLPLYLAASAASMFGNAAIAVVLPWLVLERTGDPALAAVVAALSAAPAAVAAFVGGALVDRIGRRRVSVLADVGSAVSVAALALVDAWLGLDLTWFIVLGIAGALFDVPGLTARQTLLADVSETSGVSLDRIASMTSVIFGLSFLAGPALAGVLLTVLPAIQVVWITAACSGLAAVLIAVMPLTSHPTRAAASESPFAGWRIVRGHPALTALLLIQLASVIVVAPLVSVILPAFFRELAQPGQLGFSLSAYALGSIVGSAIYGAWLSGRRWPAWVASNVLYAVSMLLIGSLAGFGPIAAGMVLAGIGSGLQAPITQVLFIEWVPDEARGRVLGLSAALSSLASPLGLGVMAAVLSVVSIHVAAVVIAAGTIAVAVYAIVARGLVAHLKEAGATP